jgi:hypothetical protein
MKLFRFILTNGSYSKRKSNPQNQPLEEHKDHVNNQGNESDECKQQESIIDMKKVSDSSTYVDVLNIIREQIEGPT